MAGPLTRRIDATDRRVANHQYHLDAIDRDIEGLRRAEVDTTWAVSQAIRDALHRVNERLAALERRDSAPDTARIVGEEVIAFAVEHDAHGLLRRAGELADRIAKRLSHTEET